MARLFEDQCVYCKCYSVLNRYCRACESHQPEVDNESKVNDATEDNSNEFDYDCDTTIESEHTGSDKTDKAK